MCEKLKEEIPRQLFEIPIQAAIGSKIIARETVKAMRKDVLAKCYGGDISRKRKLSGETERGKETYASGGKCRDPAEGIYECIEVRRELEGEGMCGNGESGIVSAHSFLCAEMCVL